MSDHFGIQLVAGTTYAAARGEFTLAKSFRLRCVSPATGQKLASAVNRISSTNDADYLILHAYTRAFTGLGRYAIDIYHEFWSVE